MALVDTIDTVNTVLDFYERVKNLYDRSLITANMYNEMESQIIEYLETIFPPPPAP